MSIRYTMKETIVDNKDFPTCNKILSDLEFFKTFNIVHTVDINGNVVDEHGLHMLFDISIIPDNSKAVFISIYKQTEHVTPSFTAMCQKVEEETFIWYDTIYIWCYNDVDNKSLINELTPERKLYNLTPNIIEWFEALKNKHEISSL